MAANDEDTRGLNEVDSDSNHEVSDNSDNKINPDYASMAARLLIALSLNQYYIIIMVIIIFKMWWFHGIFLFFPVRTVANIKRLQENVLSVSISTSSSFNNVSTVSVGQTSPSPIQSQEAENCQILPSSIKNSPPQPPSPVQVTSDLEVM